MQKRGQVSMEMLFTVGFALVMLIPLTILFYEQTTGTKGEVDAQQGLLVVRKIADNANEVYYLGQPSSVVLKIYVPDSVLNITIQGNEVVIFTRDGAEIVGTADINLTGNLSASSGLRFIRISAITGGVNVTDET